MKEENEEVGQWDEGKEGYAYKTHHYELRRIDRFKVATYRHLYRAEPKEPTKFGSVSGSEIHFQPTFSNGICI